MAQEQNRVMRASYSVCTNKAGRHVVLQTEVARGYLVAVEGIQRVVGEGWKEEEY